MLRLSVPPGIDSYRMGDVLPHAVANFKSLTTLTLAIPAGDTLHSTFINTILNIIPNILNLKVLSLPASALNGNILHELSVQCRRLEELHSTYVLPQFGVLNIQDDGPRACCAHLSCKPWPRSPSSPHVNPSAGFSNHRQYFPPPSTIYNSVTSAV